MKLDLKHLKKIHIDKDTVTMQHPDGHTIKVALKALHPKMREQFHVLPMADGGKIPQKQSNPKLEESKKLPHYADGEEVQDYTPQQPSPAIGEETPPQQMVEQAAAPQPQPEQSPQQQALAVATDRMKMQMHPNMQGPRLGLGDVTEAEQQNSQQSLGAAAAGTTAPVSVPLPPGVTPAAHAAKQALDAAYDAGAPLKVIRQLMNKFQVISGRGGMAEGGEIENNPNNPWIQSKADGGDVQQPKKDEYQDAGKNLQQDPNNAKVQQLQKVFPSYDDGGDVQQPQQVDVDLNPKAPGEQQQMQPMMALQNLAQQPEQQQQPNQLPQAPVGPDFMQGYGQQQAGIQAEAKAQGNLGKAQASDLQTGIKQQQDLLNNFQASYKDLDAERQAHIQDIQNGHIDPDKYWDNHSRIAKSIGIILAGFDPKGRPNQALQMLNNDINRSMDSQAAEIHKNENLLAANFHQFGNLKDAQSMTRIMLQDTLQSKLQMEAAKAADPLAKAHALQLAGALQQQTAPMMMQMNMRQALMKSGHDQNSQAMQQEDPASYVPFVVPKEHQEAVYKEIKEAQDMRALKPKVMAAFDQAAQFDTSKLIPGVESAGQQAFSGLINTTVKDLEGTARQAAFDSIKSNMRPSFGDKSSKVATKRQTTSDYMDAKSAAPRAKSYGIDLDKFTSTSRDPYMQLSPQQQQFLNFARQNPQDPRSPQILQKLGIKQ